MSKNSKHPPDLPEHEWTQRVEVDDIDFQPSKWSISPDAEQRGAIALRLGIPALQSLKSRLTAHRIDGGHIIKVEGVFNAKLVQNCVVSGAEIKQTITAEFEAYYSDPRDAVPFTAASRRLKQKKEIGAAKMAESKIMEEWEDPETTEQGTIDLGELSVQYLSLHLDPFPHAPGQALEDSDEGNDLRKASDIRRNPFAALQYWNEDKDTK